MISDRPDLVRELDVSRETFERLEAYVALLMKWNSKINLVSSSNLDNVWIRHVLDSAQALDIAPTEATRWSDFGSGGGFPGAVVAIIAAEKRPHLQVTLVESDQRKAAFLRTVARTVGIKMRVIATRIEALEPLHADIVSARALAPLRELLALTKPHLTSGGAAIFLKGAGASQEVEVALETWRFDCEAFSSKTDADAVILKIGGIERV